MSPHPLSIAPINESSINRILSHGKYGFIVISAHRSGIYSKNERCDLTADYLKFLGDRTDTPELRSQFLEERNKTANKKIKEEIDKSKYSYTNAYGGYHGSDGVEDSFEPTYIIYNKPRMKANSDFDFEDLKHFGMEMCGTYRQDSFYCQAPGQPPVWLDADGNRVSKDESLDFKINRENETFFTTSKRKKKNPKFFTADISPLDECYDLGKTYVKFGAGSYVERMRMSARGEEIVYDYRDNL